MKIDIDTLRDTFKNGYEEYESSREEANVVEEFFHNNQFDDQQLQAFKDRRQPAETYNIVKCFSRLLVGYYSTVVNTVKVQPRQDVDSTIAKLLHDVTNFTLEYNHFETAGDAVKYDAILYGLMCTYTYVIHTDDKDEFDRTIKRIGIAHVPAKELVLDPMSKKEDYSDGRYVHRFKWLSEAAMSEFLKTQKSKVKIEDLDEFRNHTDEEDADFYVWYKNVTGDYYENFSCYLLVHTIIKDDRGTSWSVYWCCDKIIAKRKIINKDLEMPYTVQKVAKSNKAEYYGVFREVLETQKAINQALSKIQLMANTEKVLVQRGSVDDMNKFKESYNKLNSFTEVKKIEGIKVVDQQKEVAAQYALIDKALERIQFILGINDSFLGVAYASDSGRKVKLQQGATVIALRYLTTSIEQFYRKLGLSVVNHIKIHYTATEAIRIADDPTSTRWLEVNKPLKTFTGTIGPDGKPIMQYAISRVLDPLTGEYAVDKNGRPVYGPVPSADTDISFSRVDIQIDTVPYNDEDERNQLMLEQVLQGGTGQALMQADPVAYLEACAISVRNVKTKNSHDIAQLFSNAAKKLLGAQGEQINDPNATDTRVDQNNPSSQTAKLPTNTERGG